MSRWIAAVVACLSLPGCLTFHSQQNHLVSASYPAPVRLTGSASDRVGSVSPFVALTSSKVKGTQRDGFGGLDREDGPFTWSMPTVQLGVAGEVGLIDGVNVTDRIILSGALLGGRRSGRWSWATDGSLGARFFPRDLGLWIGAGVRARNSHFAVSYTERYVEEDVTRSFDGRLDGTAVHIDPYAAVTLNSCRTGNRLNAFLTVDAGIYTLLRTRPASELTDRNHNIVRGAAGAFVTYGLHRQLSAQRRAVMGLRVGQIGGGAAVELLLRVDRLY